MPRSKKFSAKKSRTSKTEARNDSKIPSAKILSKSLTIKQLDFHPLQEVRLWVPGTQVTFSSSAGSVISRVDLIDPTTTGASAFKSSIWGNYLSLFREFLLLHAKVTIVPIISATAPRAAYLAVGINDDNHAAGSVTINMANGAEMVPVSTTDQACTQFTVFSRNYDQLSFLDTNGGGALVDPYYMQTEGDSTTGMPVSLQVCTVMVHYFVCFRGIRGV